MKNIKFYLSGSTAALFILCGVLQSLQGASVTADIIKDGDFSEDPTKWIYGGGWRDNGGGNENAVFDAKESSNDPFMGFAALRNQIDLTAITAFTSAPNFNANTTRLTGIATDTVSHLHRVVAGAKLGGTYDYQMSWEIDINLLNGDKYRLKSNAIDPTLISTGTTLNGGDEFNSWLWQGGSYSGDPANANGGGIVIADIDTFNVKLLMRVVDPHDGVDSNPDTTETVYYIADNVTVSATINTIPETSHYAIIASVISCMCIIFKRKRITNRP